ncbi:MAG TPA: right-handed parallel beta-helix repeat-containing protein [Stellaceae bacterium]|nr:right-handed parallel beta-helix repeat-containing protein [Stellaceae bacterium]
MTRRWLLRLLPFAAFARRRAAAAPEAAATIVSVADFGAIPGSPDATAGIRAAIAHLPRRGGATLLLPPGAYNVSGDAKDDAVLRCIGIEKLTVDGRGATLNVRGKTFPAVFDRCDGLFVRGLTVDWPRPPFSQGMVVAVGAGGTTVDIKIDDEFPVDGSEPVQAITTHERGSLRMPVHGLDADRVVDRVTLSGRQRLRLALKRPLPLHAGDVVVLRHQIYGTNVFHLTACRDVRFAEVNVYAAPGMALLAAGCTNVTIDRFRVEPRPGTARLMSTCADGLHIASCHGRVEIRNCYIGGLGDDCINVHGRVLTVAERLDARTLLVDLDGHGAFTDMDLASPGDRVEFLDRRSLKSRGEATVAASAAGPHQRLRFAGDLPAGVEPGDFLCDVGEITRLTISDSEFPGNRGRGILAHRNVAIERCSFADQFYEAILLLFDNSGEDGPTIGNVVIARNRFHGTGRAGAPHGAIRIQSVTANAGGLAGPVAGIIGRGISIVDNLIVDSGGSAIEVGEAGAVTIARNRIDRRGGPAIILDTVGGVLVGGNVCKPPAPLVLRNTPTSEIKLKDNRGLLT